LTPKKIKKKEIIRSNWRNECAIGQPNSPDGVQCTGQAGTAGVQVTGSQPIPLLLYFVFGKDRRMIKEIFGQPWVMG